jgi:hypothetical protein
MNGASIFPETILVEIQNIVFSRNHLSLESIIFSTIFAKVLKSNIGLYDLTSNLFFL